MKKKKNRNKLEYQNHLLENVDEAIISTDEEMRIVSWNNAAERIYGYTSDEVKGKNIDEILKTEFLETNQKEAQKCIAANGFWKGEIIQERKSGKKIHIEAKVSFIRNEIGNIIGRVSSNRDITARANAYKKIQMLESRNRKLMDMAPVGISISKVDDIIYVNKKFLEIYGFDKVSDLKKYERADFMHPDDAEYVKNYFNKKKHNSNIKMNNFSIKYRIINNRNKLKYLWLNMQLIEINDTIYRYGIFLDQTNEMESEKNLRALVANNVFVKEQRKFLKLIRNEFLKIAEKYKIEESDYSNIQKLYYKYNNPEEEWHITKEHFEAVHQDFFKNLKSRFTSLTQNDLRHCAYIKMNYNTKEIARIFSITDKSVQKSRVRLKKKLNLTREDDLYFFIQNL